MVLRLMPALSFSVGYELSERILFSEEHSFDEPSNVEFSKVLPHIELIDPFYDMAFLNLGPTPAISSPSSPLLILAPSLEPPKFTFVESKSSVHGRPWLDQTLDNNDKDRLGDHFTVKNLALCHSLSIDFHISFYWPCFGPLPSSFRDVGFHFDHSDHFRWFTHAYSHIFIKPLICTPDVACIHLSSDWAATFDISSREP